MKELPFTHPSIFHEVGAAWIWLDPSHPGAVEISNGYSRVCIDRATFEKLARWYFARPDP
jgi:hypothetical protein